jgi:UDP-N-acetylglucosamine 2-epimerase (non-hydrolysing)
VKVLTILGTRPEIIRLCRIVHKLDAACTNILVHTGQNYDYELNEVFFKQLGVRQPDHFLRARGTFGSQMSTILCGLEKILRDEKPDKFLVLGDTNSSLGAIMAKRLGIPVYHMEAGNRCHDDRVPEEVNRRIIDHSSDVLLPYTERSRENLLREGIPGERIYVTGNPIYEVLEHYKPQTDRAAVIDQLELKPQGYFLVTLHRAENVDVESRLRSLTVALDRIQKDYGMPVIVSTHPHTKASMQSFGVAIKNEQVRFLPPFSFFDFIALEKNARCVLSDSGTVQEECAIFRIPNVTIRDVTERPETLECGSSMLSGADADTVVHCVRTVLRCETPATAPREYLIRNVSDTILKIVAGYHHK